MVEGVVILLLLSYIIVAALELVMTVLSFQAGNISFAWSFGFLLFLSIASIPLETSEMGKLVRLEFQKIGVNTARYDFISNLGRTVAYLLIILGFISQIEGLILAYAVTFLMLARAIWKYVQIEKGKD